jgi:hypothetical protein
MKNAPVILFTIAILCLCGWAGARFIPKKSVPLTPDQTARQLDQSLEGQLDELAKSLKVAEEHAVQASDQLAEAAQSDKEHQFLVTMMQEQAKDQKDQIKRWQDIADELNREKREEANKKNKPMPIGVTILLGLAALWILLSQKFPPSSTKWAIGILGVIAGFWLGG